MSNSALLPARFLAATGPGERSGHGAQPPLPPGRSRRDGAARRALVTASWVLVAVMLGAIVALAAIG